MAAKSKKSGSKPISGSLPSGRVSDFVEKQVEVDDFFKLKDRMPYECVITGIQERAGKDGEYLIILGTDKEKGTTIGFSCGSVAVVRKLLDLQSKNAFPVLGEFFQPAGKRYYDVR